MVLTGKTLGGDHPPFFLPVSTHVLTGPKVKRVPPPGTNWYYFFYILLSNQSFLKPFITLRVNIFLTHRPPHALQCGITTFFPDSSKISKAKVKMHLPFNLFLGCQISLYCNLQPDDNLGSESNLHHSTSADVWMGPYSWMRAWHAKKVANFVSAGAVEK